MFKVKINHVTTDDADAQGRKLENYDNPTLVEWHECEKDTV